MSSARDLPCILTSLPKNYQLEPCMDKERQKWRYASASAAVKGLTEAAKYFPELSSLLDSLDDYSLCERHYNQVIVKKSFMKNFTKLNDSSFSDSEEVERKRRKLTGDNDGVQAYEKSFSNFWSPNIYARSSI